MCKTINMLMHVADSFGLKQTSFYYILEGKGGTM